MRCTNTTEAATFDGFRLFGHRPPTSSSIFDRCPASSSQLISIVLMFSFILMSISNSNFENRPAEWPSENTKGVGEKRFFGQKWGLIIITVWSFIKTKMFVNLFLPIKLHVWKFEPFRSRGFCATNHIIIYVELMGINNAYLWCNLKSFLMNIIL